MDTKLILTSVLSLSIGLAGGYLLASHLGQEETKPKQNRLTDINVTHKEQPQIKVTRKAAPVDDSKQREIDTLKEENYRLKLAVVKANQATSRAKALAAQANNEVVARKIAMKVSIPDYEVAAVVPEPFTKLVMELNGDAALHFMEYFNEQQEGQWAFDTEQLLRQALSEHELSASIQLDSVSCRETLCEIRGFQESVSSYSNVSKKFTKSDWWPFTHSYSSNSYSAEFGNYFYVLLKK